MDVHDDQPPAAEGEEIPLRLGFGARLRNYFLTGLVIAGPLGITVYLTWSLIQWIDGWVKRIEDIVLGSFFLLCASPLMMLIAIFMAVVKPF